MTDGYIIIEKPEGAPIFVDGVLVGTISAPVTDKGTLTIDSAPRGAKIYLKKTAGYVYHGLTPQTLTLPAGPVPYILRLEKAEFEYTYDIIYIPPETTVSKTYHLERVWAEEPSVEPTASVTVRSTPPAELWMYMEGAEGFVSYGTTPKTLTLKATRGMWVAMEEAKAARAEGRVSGEEVTRLDVEIARRAEMVRLAKEAYDEAKAARVEADELSRAFRTIYNGFLAGYNTFLSRYSNFKSRYNAATADERKDLESENAALETEKARWDVDLKYWSDMLKYYEERMQLLREYENQMKDEWEEAKVRALAPYWMVTPGLLGTTWRLKITKEGHQEVIDRFTLDPGGVYTKDYALAPALDLTTPESLAPLVLSTPPPAPPAVPISHAWMFATSWGGWIGRVWYDGARPPIDLHEYSIWRRKNWMNLGPEVCKGFKKTNTNCDNKFIKVPPGKHTYYFILHRKGGGAADIIVRTLNLAPGETRYVSMDYIATKNTDWGTCPF